MQGFLLFLILVPIIELWIVGSLVGPLPTLAWVVLSAVVGMALMRGQGMATLMRANQRAQAGQNPAQEIAGGLFLAAGGMLLVIPEFFTDLLGIICLIPGIRSLLLARMINRWQTVEIRGFGFGTPGGSSANDGANSSQAGDQTTIEGEYKRED